MTSFRVARDSAATADGALKCLKTYTKFKNSVYDGNVINLILLHRAYEMKREKTTWGEKKAARECVSVEKEMVSEGEFELHMDPRQHAVKRAND